VWQIDWCDIAFNSNPQTGQRKRHLGKGGFGTVYGATYLGKSVAVKVLDREAVTVDIGAYMHEVKSCNKMRHTNIVTFYGATLCDFLDGDDDTECAIVMGRGDFTLREAIASQSTHATPYFQTVEEKVVVLAEVCEALMYLHQSTPRPVVHRDIKCENVMINRGERRSFLIDFGLATVKSTTTAIKSRKGAQAYQVPFGYTEWYAAPEVLCTREPTNDPAQDVYAFGCLAFELLMQTTVWPAHADVVAEVAGNHLIHEHFAFATPPPLTTAGCALVPTLQAITQDCTQFDAKKRPGMAETYCRLRALLSPAASTDPAAAGVEPDSVDASTPACTAVFEPAAESSREELLTALEQNGHTFGDVRLSGVVKLVDDGFLASVAEHCSGLHSLDVSFCSSAIGHGLTTIALRCPRLCVLRLTSCDSVADEVLESVVELAPDLSHVFVNSCRNVGDAGVDAIASGCSELVELSVNGTKVTDSSISAIAVNCRKLQRLWAAKCKGVTDDSIRLIAQHCPELTLLHVTGCKGVTDEGVRCVAQHCSALRDINVNACRGVTNAGVVVLAEQCRYLRHLSVASCTSVADRGVEAVARGCPELLTLAVDGAEGVTDVSVACIAARCPSLQVLSVSMCTAITDGSIAAVAASCTQLQKLSVRYCALVTDEVTRGLSARGVIVSQ
jgi:serine/threonine protein kinase